MFTAESPVLPKILGRINELGKRVKYALENRVSLKLCVLHGVSRNWDPQHYIVVRTAKPYPRPYEPGMPGVRPSTAF